MRSYRIAGLGKSPRQFNSPLFLLAATAEFEDDPEAPRIGYVPEETIGDAEGAVIGAGIYVPAIAGSLAVVASGGTMLGAFAVAAIAGGAGGLIGAALARFIGREHAKHLDAHLQRGGLLLWVRTYDAEHEKKGARDIASSLGIGCPSSSNP